MTVGETGTGAGRSSTGISGSEDVVLEAGAGLLSVFVAGPESAFAPSDFVPDEP